MARVQHLDLVKRVAPSSDDALDSRLLSAIRAIVREELRRDRDIRSFAAASDIMTINETLEYCRIGSRQTLDNKRAARRRAKTDEERDAAFAPEYRDGGRVWFRQSEVKDWLDRQKAN